MQFDKLRISGFKSFVDPTELVIGKGLTGVVGPNGCGKSNLVEALRWVMGETSAKRMRGGAMDDVIFSGTQARPSRNVAEVVLSIDNSDRSAPAAFNDSDELEISRTIERESGSSYRVNGGEVRARDVQLLFADAASGAHSPALVSQGRIGTIINSKPTERRTLLEEAAGITGLHSRRHEAELRLRGAEANLERLDDVMQALEAQLQNIKRQARQANRYRRVADQIRHDEGIQLHLLFTEAQQRIAAAGEQLDRIGRQVGELTEAVTQANVAHALAAEKLPALRQTEAEAGARLHRLAVARDALDEEERRIEQACNQLRGQIGQIGSDEERARNLADDANAAMERLRREREELTAAQGGEAEAQAQASSRVDEAATALAGQESELETLTDRVANLGARRESLERARREAGQRIERLRQRLTEIGQQRQTAEAEARNDTRLAQAATRIEEARDNAETAREALATAEEQATTTEEAANRAREESQRAEAADARLEAEEQTLSRLFENTETDLFPPLIDAVRVEPGMEAALGVAMGDDLDAPADEAAPVHWRTLAADADAPALPSGATPLSRYVQAPPALARRLSQIGVVETGDGARMMTELRTGQRLVSRDGALWRWDGYTVRSNAETAAARRLEQRNRLSELRTQREELAPGRERAKAAAAAAREAAQAAKARLAEIRQQARLAEEELNSALSAHGKAEREAAARSSRLTALAENMEQVSADLAETESAAERAATGLGELPDLDDLRQQLAELRRKVADLRSGLVEARNAQDQLRREAAARANRISAIDGEVEAWTQRSANAGRQIDELRERQAQARNELAELERKPAEISERRRALLDQIETAETGRTEAASQLNTAETSVGELQKALRQAEQTLASAREDRVRAEAGVEQANERREEIVRRITETLECAPHAVLETAGVDTETDLPPLVEVERRLDRLKKERDRMGPVNLRAEQEAQELEEQLGTMQSEREDLEAAIARLRHGIGSLNREGRERLLAAFKQVDEHFQDLFVRLFGGGKAHLALTESDDPLEAGLEIMASPPGKRLQNLSLLSGGEQALTALSLLFAVFLTNPAPVCVLDEVDAPLDDANVERFCNLVTEIARTSGTRFLIITHHPFTMARMDRLFGVTMAERGVSQLLSIDLARAERIRATA